MGPRSIAATIYQAFTLRLGREVARAAIGIATWRNAGWTGRTTDSSRT